MTEIRKFSYFSSGFDCLVCHCFVTRFRLFCGTVGMYLADTRLLQWQAKANLAS